MSNLLILTQYDRLIHIEQLLAPFREIWRIHDYLGAEMPIALLVALLAILRRRKHIVLMLQPSYRVVLYRRRCQHAKLAAAIVLDLLVRLMRGMRAAILDLDLDLLLHLVAMAVVAIEGVRLEGMRIGILQLAQVLVEHGIVVEAAEVESGLRRERVVLLLVSKGQVRVRMMRLGMRMRMGMLQRLAGLGLQRAVRRVRWQLLVQERIRLHRRRTMR